VLEVKGCTMDINFWDTCSPVKKVDSAVHFAEWWVQIDSV